jgi:hypothetical protein
MTGNKLKHFGSVFGGDAVAQKNVVFKLASKIRKLVLESAVDPIKKKVSKETEKQKGLTFPESAGGRGKIRYIELAVVSNFLIFWSSIMKNLCASSEIFVSPFRMFCFLSVSYKDSLSLILGVGVYRK